MNDCHLSKTRVDKQTIEIPVFLFFTWPRNNRPVRRETIHSKTRFNKHSSFLWCEMRYRCTRAHHISDSDPCSLGVIADARVTNAAHHTPESANQIRFPPYCSVLPSHTPAHWLHRCMCTLWHPANMHALGPCAQVKFILMLWSWLLWDSRSIHVSELLFDLVTGAFWKRSTRRNMTSISWFFILDMISGLDCCHCPALPARALWYFLSSFHLSSHL